MKKSFALTVMIALLTCGSALAIDQLGDATVTSVGGCSIYGGVNATDATSASAVLLGKMSKGVYVITSYSIHYTKLYENLVCRR